MKADWITKAADRVESHVRQHKGDHATIVCASGISPSGPVHLGNLREPMTVHLVSEELRQRGWQVEHIHSWDDYDRLRKVPANVPEDFARYIGMPYAAIPDPFGEFDSYATRYITDFSQGLDRLGIHPRYIRQSVAYQRGDYVESIRQALRHRHEIFDILAEYQQKREDLVQTLNERRAAYYPFKVYCDECKKDTTQITSYDDSDASLTYRCEHCGHQDGYSLHDKVNGKLVWKVDWPMRWGFEQVDFEPGGEDHSSPGSSYTVGQRIVKELFNWQAPAFIGYAFVGMGGRSKISSSVGTNATLSSALDIIEPALLRWLYARRANNQAFDIDYGQGLLRLYDEWDSLVRLINKGNANELNQRMFEHATHTTTEEITHAKTTVPFSVLTSVLDVTQANEEQVLRIISQTLQDVSDLEQLRGDLEPRFTCAFNWVTRYLPDDERTVIRTTFAVDAYGQLPELDRASVALLSSQLDSSWNLARLTELMYSIPKSVRNLPLDAAPTDELKAAQRSFFIALYTLICGSDTGPRIPTLLLSIGLERAKLLLTPPDSQRDKQAEYHLAAR